MSDRRKLFLRREEIEGQLLDVYNTQGLIFKSIYVPLCAYDGLSTDTQINLNTRISLNIVNQDGTQVTSAKVRAFSSRSIQNNSINLPLTIYYISLPGNNYTTDGPGFKLNYMQFGSSSSIYILADSSYLYNIVDDYSYIKISADKFLDSSANETDFYFSVGSTNRPEILSQIPIYYSND